MKIAASVLAFIIIAALSYGGWIISRQWNYSFGYERMVKDTICKMVKPEHLKEPCDK